MFESLIALDVKNEAGYRTYREQMIPILKTYGGDFRYDFVVSKTLKTQAAHAINRVFVIVFPDQDHSDRFFADPAYKAVRQRFFAPSVGGVTHIAEYLRTP